MSFIFLQKINYKILSTSIYRSGKIEKKRNELISTQNNNKIIFNTKFFTKII